MEMEPRFVIFVETVTGEIVRAFTWCRDEISGIERARRDAELFGANTVRVWAEPIAEKEPA
jgi:hypothetical protein